MIVPWTLAADFAQLAAEAGRQGTAGVGLGRLRPGRQQPGAGRAISGPRQAAEHVRVTSRAGIGDPGERGRP